MSGEEESKRERVRRVLINPLLRAGMRKQQKMKEPDYAEMLVRLSDRLGYMSEENLRGMVPFLTRWAKGKERNQWPDEVSIMSLALSMQTQPPRKCDFAVSVLRSEAGRRAEAMGYLPELLMSLRQFGPPFGKFNMSKIAEEAKANRAELARLTGLLERGGELSLERRQWMDWYLRHEAEAQAIMHGDFEVEDAA